jgi:hypothetical protein
LRGVVHLIEDVADDSAVQGCAGFDSRGRCRSVHLIESVGEEMIETLDPNKAETRIFHIGHDIERDGQGSRKDHHVYSTVPCRRGHPEPGEQ